MEMEHVRIITDPEEAELVRVTAKKEYVQTMLDLGYEVTQEKAEKWWPKRD
jgi:hypothetical protein